jgi:uncharacterized membrane protein
MLLPIHILAGGLALIAGAVALAAAKGARLHRRSGTLFVYAMLTMAIGGVLIAAVRGAAPAMNIPAGLTTAYLVVTGLITVRPPSAASRRVAVAAMIFGLSIGLTSVALAVAMLADGRAGRTGMAYPLFMFGIVGLGAGLADVRVIRSGGVHGAARLTRHLWRMCFALFVATSSFFLGQAKVFPEAIRNSGILALPVLAVLASMLYWLWRTRGRRSGRAIAGITASGTI